MLANEAQTDIVMDYSWLDDVSTHDWTRYHELNRGGFFSILSQDARIH